MINQDLMDRALANIEANRAAAIESAANQSTVQNNLEDLKAQFLGGEATYNWISNPAVFGVQGSQFNAKDLPFSERGVGIINYGWNENNIFSQIDKTRNAYKSGESAGGWREIYNNMLKYVGKHPNREGYDLFKRFLETGERPEGLSLDTILEVSDYGLREVARKQQRKTKSFLGGNIGAIIGAIGGAAIGFAFGGPQGAVAGAKAGGAAGGAGQAINEKRGLLGTALATVGGYGIGSLGGALGTAGANTAASIAAKQAAGQTFRQAALSTIRSGFSNALQQGIGSLRSAITSPLQSIKSFGTQFYQDAVNPFVQFGRGGIGSLKAALDFNPATTLGSGFTQGSGGFFSGGSSSAFANPGLYKSVSAPLTTAKSTPVTMPSTAPGDHFGRDIFQAYPGGRDAVQSIIPQSTAVSTPSTFTPLFEPTPVIMGAVTTPTAPASALAGGVLSGGLINNAIEASKTVEDYRQDAGVLTEEDTYKALSNIRSEGGISDVVEDPQLATYDFQGVGQPMAYTPPGGYAAQEGVPYSSGYERGALGSRVFGGSPTTLNSPFDLSPYFQTPRIFNEGGSVDAGQYKGFPFMDSLPAEMQSKFKAYESGTQSYMDSSGEQVEEGYTRLSGSDMDPVEERYVMTPMGVQEFFSRSPSGHYRLNG